MGDRNLAKTFGTFRKDIKSLDKTNEENKAAKDVKKDIKEVIKNNREAMNLIIEDNKRNADRMEKNIINIGDNIADKIGEKLIDLMKLMIPNQQNLKLGQPAVQKVVTSPHEPAVREKIAANPALMIHPTTKVNSKFQAPQNRIDDKTDKTDKTDTKQTTEDMFSEELIEGIDFIHDKPANISQTPMEEANDNAEVQFEEELVEGVDFEASQKIMTQTIKPTS